MTAKAPKFSIVTSTFNAAKTLRETIESVRAQDFKDYEHLVIDGGSTDATLEIVKEYPRLDWISEKDKGLYYAMNKGVRRARGEILLMLNADDCLTPGALAHVAAAFDKNPDWDAAFGDIIFVDGEGREIYRREEAGYDYDILRYSGVCYVIHQTLYVKKALHDRIGLYREGEFHICADYEFILRMGKSGARVGHVPHYLVRYRYHDHGLSADLRANKILHAESERIRAEYGCPTGPRAKILRGAMRIKRQLQKLVARGKLDLRSGNKLLASHRKEKTSASSNIPIEP